MVSPRHPATGCLGLSAYRSMRVKGQWLCVGRNQMSVRVVVEGGGEACGRTLKDGKTMVGAGAGCILASTAA